MPPRDDVRTASAHGDALRPRLPRSRRSCGSNTAWSGRGPTTRRRWCCCTKGWAASACGAISRTSLRPRPAAACSSIRASGYGQSSPAKLPRTLDFMHDEARETSAAPARRHRLPAGPAGRPQRRRVDRRDLRRQRAGSSRARAGADGAAFHRRGRDDHVDRGDPQGLRHHRSARSASSAGTPTPTPRCAAGPMSG